MENKKNISLIATAISALLCGCPALCLLIFGITTAAGEGTYDILDQSGQIESSIGYALICLGVLLGLIPVGIGGYTFWLVRKEKKVVEPEEPIPPAM
jgi:Na+-driven multidrug efflux pump